MEPTDDITAVEQLRDSAATISQELAKVVVGQKDVVEQLLIALFAGGHCLLVGVPGLAKTLIVRSVSQALSLDFSRIQFTPDLMPSDITGTEVIQEDKDSGKREFRFIRGPIFANIVLADEINRTPPKTQAALLEAMQEHQVTAAGVRHRLEEPFFVLATQNPIEQEGTYPLPEAQLDRFMFQVDVAYPDELEELDIVMRTTADEESQINPTLNVEQITQMKKIVRRIPISEHLALYGLRLARMSRPQSDDALDFVRSYVSWGAGPRASQYIVLGAKARAAIQGRMMVESADIQAVAAPVLRHRIRTNFTADAEGVSSNDIVDRLLKQVPVMKKDSARGNVPEVFRSADAG